MTSIERQQVPKQVVQFYTEISNFNKIETLFILKNKALRPETCIRYWDDNKKMVFISFDKKWL